MIYDVSKIEKGFGAILKKYRRKADLTQYDLADMAEISRQPIAIAETKPHLPTMYVALCICNALNIKLETVLSEAEKIGGSNDLS